MTWYITKRIGYCIFIIAGVVMLTFLLFNVAAGDPAAAEVSGGQRQRIMLAVAAMLNKPLIIIDEPTSALDADSTGRVLSFFRRQAERGTAVLAVSHDKDFASGCHYLIEL